MTSTTRRFVATVAIAGAAAAGAAAVPLALGSQSAAGTVSTPAVSQHAGEFLCLDLSNLNLPSVCVAGLGGRR